MKNIKYIFSLMLIIGGIFSGLSYNASVKSGDLSEDFSMPSNFHPDRNPSASKPVSELNGSNVSFLGSGVQGYIDNTYPGKYVTFNGTNIQNTFIDNTPSGVNISNPTINSTSAVYDVSKATPGNIEQLGFRFTNQFNGKTPQGDTTSIDLAFDVTKVDFDPNDANSKITKIIINYSDPTKPSITIQGVGDFSIEGKWSLYYSGTSNRAELYKLATEYSNIDVTTTQAETVGLMSSAASKYVITPSSKSMRTDSEGGYYYFLKGDDSDSSNQTVGATFENSQAKVKYGVDTTAGKSSSIGLTFNFWYIKDTDPVIITSKDKSVLQNTAPKTEDELLDLIGISGLNTIENKIEPQMNFNVQDIDDYSYSNNKPGIYTVGVEAEKGTAQETSSRVNVVVGDESPSLELDVTNPVVTLAPNYGYTLDDIANRAKVVATEEINGVDHKYQLTAQDIVYTSNFDSNVEGTYYVVFQTYGVNTTMANSTIVTVNITNNPDTNSTFVTSNDITIKQDSFYDPIKSHDKFEAYYYDGDTKVNVDKEDGTILTIDEDVDTSVPGEYPVDYTIVSPIDGSSATYHATVTVVPESSDNTVIKGDNVRLEIGNAPINETQLKRKMNISATSGGFTIPRDDIQVVDMSGYDFDNPAVGTYPITFAAKGVKDDVIVTETFIMEIYSDDILVTESDVILNANDMPSDETELLTLMHPQMYSLKNDEYITDSVAQISDFDGYQFDVEYPVGTKFEMVIEVSSLVGAMYEPVTVTIGSEEVNADILASSLYDIPTQSSISDEELMSTLGSIVYEKTNGAISWSKDLDAADIVDKYDFNIQVAGKYSIYVETTTTSGLEVDKVLTVNVDNALEGIAHVSSNDINLDVNAKYNPVKSHQGFEAYYTDSSGAHYPIEAGDPNLKIETTYPGDGLTSVGDTYTTLYTVTNPITGNTASTIATINIVDSRSSILANDYNVNYSFAPLTEQGIIDLVVESVYDAPSSSIIDVADVENIVVIDAGGYNYAHPSPGTYNIVISYDDTGGDTVTADAVLGVEL